MQFIGPLTLEQQRWADEVQAVDAAAAIFEPLSQVLRRREERIGTYWSDSALLFLTADERAWPQRPTRGRRGASGGLAEVQ